MSISVKPFVALACSPGPNSTFALTSSIKFGAKASLKGVFGGAIGFMLLILIALLGLENIITDNFIVMNLIKITGCFYLFYLGYKLWHTQQFSENTNSCAKGLFTQGFFLAISNPKIILFWVAFIPTIIALDSLKWQTILIIIATFSVMETSFETLLVFGAKSAQNFLKKHIQMIDRTSAIIFACFGVLILFN